VASVDDVHNTLMTVFAEEVGVRSARRDTR
jgi:hypothetical protein